MKILIIFILLTNSVFVYAQKAYKYKDDSGHWIFTDKKPFSEKNIEIKQLDRAVKWIELIEEKQQDKSIYYAYSKIPAPVELQISLTKSNNVYTNPLLPTTFSISKGKRFLFEITGVEKNKPYSWTYDYRYVLGLRLNHFQNTINYLPPIKGKFKITQGFNGERTHFETHNRYAVDIAMPVGTPIYAARAGKVILVDNEFYKNTYGTNKKDEVNQITILHDDGSMAIYAHLEFEKAKVYPEMDVQAGDLIGYSGNTGYSSGPHLHFAVIYNYLGEQRSAPFRFLNLSNQAEMPIEGNWLER